MALDLFASPKKGGNVSKLQTLAYRYALKRRQYSGRLYARVFYCNRALFEDGNGKDS